MKPGLLRTRKSKHVIITPITAEQVPEEPAIQEQIEWDTLEDILRHFEQLPYDENITYAETCHNRQTHLCTNK